MDHVGLGPDFVWGWGESFNLIPTDSVTFPPYAISEGFVETIEGFADIPELPNVITGLRERGWSDAEIDKAMGENWLRVYAQVWDT